MANRPRYETPQAESDRARPRWRRFAELALQAALHPEAEPLLDLRAHRESASAWPWPANGGPGMRCATLTHVARGFIAQTDPEERRLVARVLEPAAEQVLALCDALDEADGDAAAAGLAAAPGPTRYRADIDG